MSDIDTTNANPTASASRIIYFDYGTNMWIEQTNDRYPENILLGW